MSFLIIIILVIFLFDGFKLTPAHFNFSCRYVRRDVLPLGKFTLNMSGFPTVASYTERLYQIIQQLVPSVSYQRNRSQVLLGLYLDELRHTQHCFPCSHTTWA